MVSLPPAGRKSNLEQVTIFDIIRWCVSLASHQCLYVLLCKAIKQLLTGTGKTLFLNSGFSLHVFKTNPVFIPTANFSSAVQQKQDQVSLFHHNSWDLSLSFIYLPCEAWLQNYQCIKLITLSGSRFDISGSSVSASSFRFLLAKYQAWPWPSMTFWAACHVDPMWKNGPIMSY